MENQESYNAYKSLKNSLSKLSIDDSIYVIHNYHLLISHFKDEMPSNIIVPVGFYELDDIGKAVFNWELEIFFREILVNAKNLIYSEYYNRSETLKKWNKFSNYLNKLKKYGDDASSIFINDNNSRLSINRIPHQQFKWQKGPYNKMYSFRYYKIFSHLPINNLIYNLFNLSLKEIYYIGFCTIGLCLNDYKIKLDDIYKILDKNKIDTFLKYFSLDINTLIKYSKNRKLDDSFEYDFFILDYFPIINFDEKTFFCPFLLLLFWSFTSGIYFKIRKESNDVDKIIFDEGFGKSFELYIGDVLKVSNISKFTIFPESTYSKPKKLTPDWIVYDNLDSAMFIECKTKRMRHEAKTNLNEALIRQELNEIIKASIQLYKRIKDYENNQFSSFKYIKNINIFPIIVTLENWYMSFYLDILREMLTIACKNENIDDKYLKNMPIAIFSCDEFEEIIQIINQVGIKKFMSQVHKRVFSVSNSIAVEPFVNQDFKSELKNVKFLFETEHNILMDDFKNKNI